jgi:hypothetical protein
MSKTGNTKSRQNFVNTGFVVNLAKISTKIKDADLLTVKKNYSQNVA